MPSHPQEEQKTGKFRPLLLIYEKRWSLTLGLLVLAMLSYSWMFGKITVPNERSRIYLAVAMVDEGTLSIDTPVERFGKPIDIAKYEGRYYTDKAPGSSLLGAAVYGLVRIFTGPTDWSIVELVNLARTWVMIPLGIIGFFLLRRTIVLLGVSRETSDIVALGWLLGSAAFHYSTAFFGHQIVAVALIATIFLIERAAEDSREGPTNWIRFLGAGAALGIAGITEYQSAVPCVFLGLYAIYRAFPSPGRIVGFVLGASVFLIVLLSYNNAAFGGPFELSYHHLSSGWMQAKHAEGIAGVTFPRAPAVFGTLLSLHRGLITTSPFFLLVPVGLFFMWRRGNRALCIVLGATILYYLLFIFSAEMWYGGWGFGPRLLVPSMFTMAIIVAFAGEAIKDRVLLTGLFRGLIVFSLLYNQLVHVVFAELPEKAMNPIIDAVIPVLQAGMLSPNLASKMTGSPGIWTIVPIALLTLVASAIVAFRGVKLDKKLMPKLTLGAALAAGSAVMITIILLVGQTWPDSKADKFVQNMKKWESAEFD